MDRRDIDMDYPFTRTDHSTDHSRFISYAVHGFWPEDSVRLFQRRRAGKWDTPYIKWSCGGREPEAEPDDVKAAECFGLAILDAVKLAKQWA